MRRRSFVATAGVFGTAAGAGCLSTITGDDGGPSFEIQDVQVYQPGDRTVFVAPTVAKLDSGSGHLHLRAELLFSTTADHSHEQQFEVRATVDEYMYVLPFRWDSPFLADKTYDARAKIVEGGDAGWGSETERVSAAPGTDGGNRNKAE